MLTAMKIEAIDYGERKVYTVAAFNRGIASWLARLPTVWVESAAQAVLVESFHTFVGFSPPAGYALSGARAGARNPLG